MRTQDFIARAVARIDAGETSAHKTCASVMQDGDRIYSYGYHYPLLFRVADAHGRLVWVCNDGGYSSTTARHICYARQHADVWAPIGGTHGRTLEKADVVQAIEARMRRVHADMQAKKRKDTRVYEALENEYRQHADALKMLTE